MAQEAATAHARIVAEARHVLSSRDVSKTLLVAPRYPAAPSIAAPLNRLSRASAATSVEGAEEDARNALLAREIWEREVVAQYSAMELQLNVITPLINQTSREERDHRSAIRLEETDALSRIERSSAGEAVRRDQQHAQCLFVRRFTPVVPQSGDARVSSAPTSGRLGTSTEPAMEILDRYMAARQTKIVSQQALVPKPPATLGLPSRSASLRCLDLATSVHLQNQYTYFRRSIDIAEQEERGELLDQFSVEAVRTAELTHRRQHLQRLVYWREERDLKRRFQQELDTMRELLATTEEEEDIYRASVVNAERTESENIWAAEYVMFCSVELKDLERLEYVQREQVLEEFHSESALNLIPCGEALERAGIIADYCDRCTRLWWPMLGDLGQLHIFSQHVRSNCIVIQRFFRKLQVGLAGWRRTHRMVGEWVVHYRSAKRHSASQQALAAYHQAIQAEVLAVLQEAEDDRVAKQREILSEERSERLNTETEDQWFRSGFSRRFRTDWIHNIILPKFKQLELEENRQRQGIELFDLETSFESMSSWHTKAKNVLERMRLCVQREALDRLCQVDGEEKEREGLHALARASKATVIKRQEAHQDAQRTAREDWMLSFESSRQAVAANEQVDLVNIFFQFQQSTMEVYACSPRLSGRLTIFTTWKAGVQELWSNFLIWNHAMFARQLRDSFRCKYVCLAADWLLGEAEIQKRWIASNGDVVEEYHALCSMCIQGRQEIEKRVEKRFRAVRLIQSFCRNVSLGKCGRTGMRAYLRMVFAEKRARAELRRKIAAQRDDVAQVRQELEDEIRRCNWEYGEVLSRVEKELEVRHRSAIVSQETFVVRIMKHNFNAETVDILKISIAELHQRESYFRTSVFLEWKSDHALRIEKRQSVFEKDVKIRPAQRAWRCHEARRQRRLRTIAVFGEIPRQEVAGRFKIMAHELSTFAFEIEKRFAQIKFLHDYVSQALLGCAITEESRGQRQHLTTQELEGRAQLLWSFQQSARYKIVENAERHDRELLKDFVSSNIDFVEVVGRERLGRISLTGERELFLLRLHAMIEIWFRRTVELEERASTATLLELYEPLQRQSIALMQLETLRWPLEHYESNQRLLIHLGEGAVRQQICLLHCESKSREEVEDRAQSVRNWYYWLAMVQESRQRAHLESRRVAAVALHQLEFKETIGRYDLWKQWQTQLEHPAYFASGAVIKRSPPYLYACGRMEEDLRTLTLYNQDLAQFWSGMVAQKESAFAKYLNIRLY